MRTPLFRPISARALPAYLLLLTQLALPACSDSPSDLPGSGVAGGGGAGSTGGGGTGGGTTDGGAVTMVPGPAQRNEADAGMVTKPQAKDDKPQSFVSDLTGSAAGASGRASFGGGVGGLSAGGAGTAAPPNAAAAPVTDSAAGSKGEAERAIVEADIVQVAGNRLYALSRIAGLSVIDIANPSALKLLGRYRELSGTPFEMYLRDSVAVVMFTSWGQYKKQSDGSYIWIQTSKVVALDSADPTAIKSIGSFDIAGEVSDSRLVGDVMYVVGYQNGSCWDCQQNKPLTSVLALNIADPRAIKRVDSLELASSNEGYGGGKRSISVTTQRIYIAGPEYGQQQPSGSTIQVVDISNPSGDLVEGTTVKVAGQITSRWQIDEYQNVLRVISQPFPWWREQNTPPAVQTFTVTSSQQIASLGRANLTIPANESLRTVRFDGTRGYAITAVQTDPLFTIDLSNPAQPRQMGELVMPGWIYHMEPRGDRVIGLGYDQNNAAGGITVSIFDVSNMATPRMLSRVNFGGTWAHLPEDQDRIHKAFKVLDQEGLILVPFSGWSDTQRSDMYCSGAYRSGIQLVDYRNDALTARGMAPSRGEARRAIPLGTSLLAVSDEAVDAFDISNRQSPAPLGTLTIAQNVSSALPLSNGHVARITQDWYRQQRSIIDIVTLANVDRPDSALGQLDLSKVLAPPATACSGNAYIERAFVSGNEIDLLTSRWEYTSSSYTSHKGVIVIDASDPKAPKLVSKLEWRDEQKTGVSSPQNSPWYEFSNYYQYGFSGAQEHTVRAEKTLVKLEQRWIYNTGVNLESNYELRLNVIDLSDPAALKQTFIALPKASGYAGLVADGRDVLFSHFETVSGSASARFYIDRLDLSDPKQPKLGAKVNVPGALLHNDRANGRLLTSELSKRAVDDLTSQQCYERFGFAEWAPNGSEDGGVFQGPYTETTKGKCTGYLQHLHLVRFVTGGAVLDSSYHLGEADRISSSSLGDSRVTAVLNQGAYFYGPAIAFDCFNCGRGGIYGGVAKPAQILVLGGLDTGTLDAGRLTLENDTMSWWGWYGSPPVYATGTKALVQSSADVAILDTSTPSSPKLVRTVPLYGSPQDRQTAGTLVLLALGMNGVQHIDL